MHILISQSHLTHINKYSIGINIFVKSQGMYQSIYVYNIYIYICIWFYFVIWLKGLRYEGAVPTCVCQNFRNFMFLPLKEKFTPLENRRGSRLIFCTYIYYVMLLARCVVLDKLQNYT